MKIVCKKVIIFLCVFSLIFSCLFIGVEYIGMKNEDFQEIWIELTNSKEYIRTGAEEIEPYIEKVQRQDHTTKLIVGDSMCAQIFNGLQENNSDYTIVGSNQAITMARQYLLVQEYLKSHDDVTDIYLFMHPGSIGSHYNKKLGYQYIIMPFGIHDMLKELDENTLQGMAEMYGSFFMEPMVLKWMGQAVVSRKIYFNLLNTYGKENQQDDPYEIGNQYLKKIWDICQQ